MESRTNNNDNKILASGIFKKRLWPWLFVFLAAILVIASYTQVAIEFYGENTLCYFCPDFFTYFFYHHYQWLMTTFIIVASLIVVAILCAIIFIRKRTLVITTSAIFFKKGQNLIQIPLSTIENIDTGSQSLYVFVPFKKFKFAKLENKKELYDALLSQLSAPMTIINSSLPAEHNYNDNY